MHGDSAAFFMAGESSVLENSLLYDTAAWRVKIVIILLTAVFGTGFDYERPS